MGKLSKVFTNWRILILIFVILASIYAISPQPNVKGISIVGVEVNSSANIAGIENPPEGSLPIQRERILSIDEQEINTVEDYNKIIENLEAEQVVRIRTNKDTYSLLIKGISETFILNETETINITQEVFDEDLNKTINVTEEIEVNKTEEKIIGIEDIGIKVDIAPKSNIRKGIDLRGGVRFKFKPEEQLDDEQFILLMDNMKQRLNVYGLSDVTVRRAKDLPTYLGGTGESYIIVETSTSNEESIETLKRQGKFEATVGNTSVFVGGNDITAVCRSAECSGIDTCGPASGGGYICNYRFAITLTPEAASRMAAATKDLDIIPGDGGRNDYLSEKIKFFLDDEFVSELSISAELKGREVTDPAITGAAGGNSEDEAIVNSLKELKELQTLLITGSLPVKLIVTERTVIPARVGEEFIPNLMTVGIAALIAVSLVTFLFYRKVKIALPMVLIVVSEVIILFGFAAFIRQTIDLAAIAGLIVAMGTGVDHLVIITDETLKGSGEIYDWKRKLKNAMSIIMVAFFTTVVAMVPLISAGAGVLRGFGIITIVGITSGVLIARPAYAKIIEVLLK
ncbi:hypothetical protein KY330_02910 [Candidatus Woesearchaeota archaeon]|nr:hypothetical protein [Candidatus Woesearchaeota archaeon]